MSNSRNSVLSFFKTKISVQSKNFKTQNNFSSISNQNTFQFHFKINIQNYTTKCQIEIENRKVEGLITYSTDQQIFKFEVNSGSSQELWGVNTDFTTYELKWTINAILQHMSCYPTTENPCVMMRENHKTKSCECIIIHQDELYIASNTLQEILHIVKEKYKIKINPKYYEGSNFPYDPRGTGLGDSNSLLTCSINELQFIRKLFLDTR